MEFIYNVVRHEGTKELGGKTEKNLMVPKKVPFVTVGQGRKY